MALDTSVVSADYELIGKADKCTPGPVSTTGGTLEVSSACSSTITTVVVTVLMLVVAVASSSSDSGK